MKRLKNILVILTIFSGMTMAAQVKMGNNPSTIQPSSVLEIESTNKGVLFPRVALTGTLDTATIAFAAQYTTVFNTATAGTAPNNVTPGYYYWSSADTKWIRLLDANSSTATTNTLTATGGQLVSTVNGVSNASAVNVLTTATNGLTSTTGAAGLGGTLTSATTLVTGATNTLAITGLQQSGSGDQLLAIDPLTGVLKTTTNSTFAKTVYVNSTDPNTATIFDNENPVVTNDASLKTDVANIYVGSDGSAWTYKSSTSSYVTYTAPASTAFNLAGTTTDAGSNKTTGIWRTGNIAIGTQNPTAVFEVATTSLLGTIFRRANASLQTPTNIFLQKTASADPAVNVAVTDGDFIGRITFSAANGTGYSTTGTSIVGVAVGAQTPTNNGGSLSFRTVPLGSTAAAVDRMRISDDGKVGIGTSTPQTRLDVSGAATNYSSIDAGTSRTIDFSQSNLAGTNASAGAFTLNNLKDGGSYTLAVKGPISGTATFTCNGILPIGTLTTHHPTDNGPTTAAKHTLYNFIVIGTDVYVTWMPGL